MLDSSQPSNSHLSSVRLFQVRPTIQNCHQTVFPNEFSEGRIVHKPDIGCSCEPISTIVRLTNKNLPKASCTILGLPPRSSSVFSSSSLAFPCTSRFRGFSFFGHTASVRGDSGSIRSYVACQQVEDVRTGLCSNQPRMM